jgi:hypothetical protein
MKVLRALFFIVGQQPGAPHHFVCVDIEHSLPDIDASAGRCNGGAACNGVELLACPRQVA